MNDLERFFQGNRGRLIDKWLHYFEIYERHFSSFRNKEIVLMEVGVSHGGSLQMWKEYFGGKVKIIGVDLDPRCKQLEEENVSIFIGSQSDKKFLKKLAESIPPIDILIDDGGHTMKQQITTFEILFPQIKENGIYLCEDLHTSYWLKFGGGLKRRGTFIEYSKDFIDYLNAFHSEQRHYRPNDFTRSVKSVHYYSSIIVVEKGRQGKPVSLRTGYPTLEDTLHTEINGFKRLGMKWHHSFIYHANRFLRLFRIRSIIWK